MNTGDERRIDSELFRLFRHDGHRYLSFLRRTLQEAAGDSISQDQQDRALRYAHSIKSEAAFLGYDTVAEYAHQLEDDLSGTVSAHTSDLFSKVDQLETSFEEALEGGASRESAGFDSAAEEAEAAEDLLSAELSARDWELLSEARERGERLFILECEITEHMQMLVPRRYLLVSNLEQVVNLVVIVPGVDSELPTRRFLALFTLEGDRSIVEDAVDVDQVTVLRFEEAQYDHVFQWKDESMASGLIAGTREVRLPMSTRSYEELCLYAGEMHRQLDDLSRRLAEQQLPDPRAHEILHTALRLSESIDYTVAQTSMVGLSEVLNRIETYARNLAVFLDKDVHVITKGGAHQVFLPVSHVLQELLLHLVRNALDHGIEPSEERQAHGKNPSATLQVSVRQDGEELVVWVSDDGRGVHHEAVAERGPGSGGPAPLPDNELWNVLSRPGSSSKETVGRVSGRGVGLDVVRTQVERYLGGYVELKTESGVGTTLAIHVPRAGQLVSVIIARHGRTEFALPSAHVFSLLELESRLASLNHSGNLFYRYQGEAIRVYAVEKANIPKRIQGLRGILLRTERRRAIVLADEIICQETVIRNKAEPDRIYSQTLNRDIGLVFPVAFL
ncbi:MAG: ATP-binding protein [Spirochaetota bacterium]